MDIGKSLSISDSELSFSGHCRTEGLIRIIFRAATIGEGLEPGEHTLTCELLRETADPEGGLEFRLISIMRCVFSFYSTYTYTVRSCVLRTMADLNIC